MGQQVYQHTFPNGLVLLAERMDHVRSAAFNFLIPAGCAFDPDGQGGVASVLAGLITRGAGARGSRELSIALDNLGVDSDESVGAVNMRFWGSTLARNVPAALDIYADILLRPHLPEEELEPVVALAIQDIQSLEDAPQSKVMVELRKRYYPPPFGKDRHGTEAELEALTISAVRAAHATGFRPNGTILSVAGNIEWEPLKEQVGRLFGDWKPGAAADTTPQPHTPQSAHISKETSQTQIALAYPSVTFKDTDFYSARAAVGVLSAGMSSRLFTEVREKRGLCYSVSAAHEPLKHQGAVVGYAGTRTERAQETLDVMLHELRRLKDGITEDELFRVKAGLKSSLIMSDESTSARAGTMAHDWYFLNRVRSFDEIQAIIDGLTVPNILAHLERYPVRNVTLVTLGPKPLEVKE